MAERKTTVTIPIAHSKKSVSSTILTTCIATACLAFASPAQCDELEDMLVRLLAASSSTGPNGGITNVAGANGIVGAIVSGSANGSQGIMALNQDASSRGTSQANIVVVALSNGPNAAAIARLLADQSYSNQPEGSEAVALASDTLIPDGSGLAALAIVDSYKGGSGIAQVNQSAGVGNIQRNATLIAAALGGGDASAMTEADLASTSTTARTDEPSPGQRGVASVSGSFTDFSGIAQVNQTIGTGNIVSNTVSITYSAPSGGGG
jgi:hypothetical protein